MTTAFIGRPREQTIRIMVNTGYGMAPFPGVLHNEILVKVKKGTGPFVSRPLLETEWTDQGDGFYTIVWSGSDLDTLGEFIVFITDPSFLFEDISERLDIEPAPFYIQNTSPLCMITGNLIDLGGNPGTSDQVVFQLLKVPTVSGQSFLTGNTLRAYADAFGNFSIGLVRGVKALVTIDSAGIKNVITVPDEPTASIIDLLPPVPLA